MFKNVASQKVHLLLIDSTTGLPKTGDAANLTAYVSKDHGAVTVLGDTTATELDSTNAKGIYWFDLTQAETNADTLLFTGKSSTANMIIDPFTVYTRPPNHSSLSIDSNGRLDIIKVAGTTQTAGDIPALINTLDDYVDTEVAAIKAKTDNLPSDPADASDIASSFTTVNTKLDTIDDFLDTEIAAIKAKTDGLPSDPADASDIAASFATVNTKLDTIDDFLDTEIAAILADTNELQTDWVDGGRLDLILDARASQTSVNTIDDFLDTEIQAIKDKTDLIPASPAAVGSAMTLENDAITAAKIDAGAGAELAAALLDLSDGTETGLTVRQALRLLVAASAGKLSGAATTTITIRDSGDLKNRITATVDASGNRSAVTYDLT